MGVLSPELAIKRLQGANGTQDGIESISSWMLHHSDSIRVLADCWLNLFRTESEERRIILFYIMNDVVQRAKKKHADVICSTFEQPVISAISLARFSEKLRNTMGRCLKLIAECKAFSPQGLEKMNRLIMDPNGDSEDCNYEIDMVDLAKKIEAFMDSVSSITTGFDTLQRMPLPVEEEITTKMKDRKEGAILLKDTKTTILRVEKFREAVSLNNKRLYEFVDAIENAKRMFNVQLRDVAVVEDAYVKFNQGVREVQEEVSEMLRTGVYPAGSPPRDAPSPSAEDDVFSGGVEQVLNTLRPHDVTDEADMELEEDDEPPLPAYPAPWEKKKQATPAAPMGGMQQRQAAAAAAAAPARQSVVERMMGLAAHMPTLASQMGIDPRARGSAAASAQPAAAVAANTGPPPAKKPALDTAALQHLQLQLQQGYRPPAGAVAAADVQKPTPAYVPAAVAPTAAANFSLPPPPLPPPKMPGNIPPPSPAMVAKWAAENAAASKAIPPPSAAAAAAAPHLIPPPFAGPPPGYGAAAPAAAGQQYVAMQQPPWQAARPQAAAAASALSPPGQQSQYAAPYGAAAAAAGGQYQRPPPAAAAAGYQRPPSASGEYAAAAAQDYQRQPPAAVGGYARPPSVGAAGNEYQRPPSSTGQYGSQQQATAKYSAMPEYGRRNSVGGESISPTGAQGGFFNQVTQHQTPGSSGAAAAAGTPYTPSAPGFRGRKTSDGATPARSYGRGGGPQYGTYGQQQYSSQDEPDDAYQPAYPQKKESFDAGHDADFRQQQSQQQYQPRGGRGYGRGGGGNDNGYGRGGASRSEGGYSRGGGERGYGSRGGGSGGYGRGNNSEGGGYGGYQRGGGQRGRGRGYGSQQQSYGNGGAARGYSSQEY